MLVVKGDRLGNAREGVCSPLWNSWATVDSYPDNSGTIIAQADI